MPFNGIEYSINEQNTVILLKKACPYCDKSYQSNQKAANHIVSIHQKKVDRLVSGNRSFGMYNKANIQKYERLGFSIVVHYGCVSCKETFAVKEALRKHCDLIHIISSQPGNGYLKYFV
ncbi:hypothetical protein DM01DRAFT_1285796 [Hesseltinella vesiculosa]|uniref:C2H2-type domain-containing protein n=1 Tax=Hesseltinella vesiculosa TaxID=101127 RepID=A0A1X2GK69_9FUNG|nr:hypothetical protein DM01DRAFT_1285796 [Hesseltinella vesiculosa]